MSNEAITAIWKQSRVKGQFRLALIALADAANEDFEAWLSQGKWAAMVGCSREYLNRRIIPKLIEAGEIAFSRRIDRSKPRGRPRKAPEIPPGADTGVIVWRLRRPGQKPLNDRPASEAKPHGAPVPAAAPPDTPPCDHDVTSPHVTMTSQDGAPNRTA